MFAHAVRFVRFETIGGAMRFSKTESSKREGTVSVTPSQSLALRFASVMLAAVLTASFMPVAAFADEGGTSDSEGVQNPPVQTEETQQGEQPAEPEAPAAPETPADPDQPAAPESPEATELQAPAQQPEADAPEAPSATKDESKEKSSKKDEDEELSTFAVSGPSAIKYGESATYSDSRGRFQYNWSWTSSDGGEIAISGSGRSVSVKGVKPGHVTLKVTGLGGAAGNTFNIEIQKRSVTLTSGSSNKTYDGASLTNEAVTVSGDGWAADDSVICVATGSQTDAGTSKNPIDVTFNSGSADNYNITEIEGDLVVNKCEMTLKSANLTKEFDGKPLTNGNAAIEGENFVEGQGVSYTFTGSQKIAGSSDNAFTYKPNDGTDLDNYDIKTEFGKLTVTDRSAKYEITLTPNSKSETYDGTEKSVSGFETLEFKINDQTFNVSGVEASAKGTDAGEYPVTVSGRAVVTDADGDDVTSQFTVNVVDDAKLLIGKRLVKLTSASDTREYNGKPLTNDEVTVEGDGWASGEGATYDVTGKQTLVGFSNNTFTYSLDDGTKADNYSIETSEGTLTVTSRDAKYEITVKANSDVFTYDGTEKSVSGFEALEFEVDGSIYTVGGLTAEAKGTDAGTYTAGIVGAPVVKDADGNDVSSEFAVKGENGCLAIAKRQVTATGEGFDSDQPYTGKEYSKTGCTFSNLVDGQEASITYALRGTGIGIYEGVFGDDFKVMADGKDVTANYELVEKVPGKLTIVEGDPDTPVDPDKPSSDTPSKTTGKTTATKATAAKPASKSAKTGDGIALYAMGICGVAIAAGAVAFVSRRKRNSNK